MPKKTKDIRYYESIGRRREAVARVRLYVVGKEKLVTIAQKNTKEKTKIKTGEIYVNHKPVDQIFSSLHEKARYLAPFRLTDSEGRFAVSILVSGGGRQGQLEAVVLGLARALAEVDRETYRPKLKKQRLLTRDARTRERRKVGTGGKARRRKQSPKR